MISGPHIGRTSLLAAAIVLSAAPLFAAASATATPTATVNVTSGITIGATAPLNFGTMIAGTSGGTVVLNTAGARTASGSVTLMPGSVSSGSFLVNETGPGSKRFWINIPTTISLQRSGGTQTMTISSITTSVSANCVSNTGSAPAGPSGLCPSASNYSFTVGGTLTVAASQAPGVYTGLYSVTVNRW